MTKLVAFCIKIDVYNLVAICLIIDVYKTCLHTVIVISMKINYACDKRFFVCKYFAQKYSSLDNVKF